MKLHTIAWVCALEISELGIKHLRVLAIREEGAVIDSERMG